jgi:hypothetical protein
MSDNDIKAEVFATVKKKKKEAGEITPKTRMALLQEGENDVNVGSQIIVPANSCHLPKVATSIFEDHEILYSSDSESACKIPEQASNKFGSLFISDNGKLVGPEGMLVATKIDLSDVSINNGSSKEILEEETVLYHDDSRITEVKSNGQNMLVTTQCKSEDNDAYDDDMKEDARIVSKLRTALFQGGEDDEHIASQDVYGDMSSDISNIAADNSLISSGLQFGAIYFDEKYGKNMRNLLAPAYHQIYFLEVFYCLEKRRKWQPRKFVNMETMHVEIKGHPI